LGANCQQQDFNAVYPYLYGGTDLDIDKVGFIIVQVKNDSTSYTAESLDEVFSTMDPFTCKLISHMDQKAGRFPIPIIRIVFCSPATMPPSSSISRVQNAGSLSSHRMITCVLGLIQVSSVQ
jgi:hypothetical protein